MKCREAQYWLYSFQPKAAWPADVVGHLQACEDCQQLQTQLRQIDCEVNRLTSPPSNDEAKHQLLQRIGNTPQLPVEKSSPPTRVWNWRRVGSYLAGAAALILIGWFLGRIPGQPESGRVEPIVSIKTVEVLRDKLIPVHSAAERTFVAALLKRNARLVQTSQARDRLETLLDMAADCRQHALALMEHGPRDTLPMTIDLYTQLLREGVLGQLTQAPVGTRPALQTAARSRLEGMVDVPAVGSSALPKIVEDQRDAIRVATRQTLDLMAAPSAVALPKKVASAEGLPPAAALVRFAITFCAEPDPVAKADACSNCVRGLMPYMMLYLAEDGSPQQGDMGQQFGELIQFGIYAPLDQSAAKESPEPVKAQAKRIIRDAGQAVAEIEVNLEKAPEASRAGLERAIQATSKGWERNDKVKGHGKGKGPPWKRNLYEAPEKKLTPGKGKKDQKKAAADRPDIIEPGIHTARFSAQLSRIRRCNGTRL